MPALPLKLPIYQVDAFARQAFRGNPAAVMPLENWLPTSVMQNIAMENNLAETAFFVRAEAAPADYHLRWFTPETEIQLCGHATLASAHVILTHLGFAGNSIIFTTETAGNLVVTQKEDKLCLDFPAYTSCRVPVAGLGSALGAEPEEVWQHEDYVLAVFEKAADVAGLAPDFAAIKKRGIKLVATAAGANTAYACDFVSRFFAPTVGVPEDPVTGSAHCRLIPYWAAKLGKSDMFARQISKRGGELWCRHKGTRVDIAGYCTDVLHGEFLVAMEAAASCA